MLCSHVILRHSMRPPGVRLISNTATTLPRPRGRPRKVAPNDSIPFSQSLEHCKNIPDEVPLRVSARRKGTPRSTARKDNGSSAATSLQKGKASSQTDVELMSSHQSAPGKARELERAKEKGAEGTRIKKRPSPVQGAMNRQREPHTAPRISFLAPTTNHHDLASFLEYSRKIDSKPDTSVYKGTHYEYTVIEFLKMYNFALRRTGRSNDLGIDLLGHWNLPADPQELRVLIQCKATTPRPAMIRELEGAYVGAPSGWRGADVMALLITRDPATLGVRNALQRSRLPMGFAQITEEGVLRQFMWNHVAQEARLTGMSVSNEYRQTTSVSGPLSSEKGIESAISLQWMGKQWVVPRDGQPAV